MNIEKKRGLSVDWCAIQSRCVTAVASKSMAVSSGREKAQGVTAYLAGTMRAGLAWTLASMLVAPLALARQEFSFPVVAQTEGTQVGNLRLLVDTAGGRLIVKGKFESEDYAVKGGRLALGAYNQKNGETAGKFNLAGGQKPLKWQHMRKIRQPVKLGKRAVFMRSLHFDVDSPESLELSDMLLQLVARFRLEEITGTGVSGIVAVLGDSPEAPVQYFPNGKLTYVQFYADRPEPPEPTSGAENCPYSPLLAASVGADSGSSGSFLDDVANAVLAEDSGIEFSAEYRSADPSATGEHSCTINMMKDGDLIGLYQANYYPNELEAGGVNYKYATYTFIAGEVDTNYISKDDLINCSELHNQLSARLQPAETAGDNMCEIDDELLSQQ